MLQYTLVSAFCSKMYRNFSVFLRVCDRQAMCKMIIIITSVKIIKQLFLMLYLCFAFVIIYRIFVLV